MIEPITIIQIKPIIKFSIIRIRNHHLYFFMSHLFIFSRNS